MSLILAERDEHEHSRLGAERPLTSSRVERERWDRDRADPLLDGLIDGLAELRVDAGRTLLMLDTISGSEADRLYRSPGWTEVGSVPSYATMPDGELAPTTFFYRELGS